MTQNKRARAMRPEPGDPGAEPKVGGMHAPGEGALEWNEEGEGGDEGEDEGDQWGGDPGDEDDREQEEGPTEEPSESHGGDSRFDSSAAPRRRFRSRA